MWWENAVIYQIYPRSFQDSNGDGIGDLAGIESRLDHLVELGADGLWTSPIYPSPMADFGYDVSGYEDIDPVFGDLASFDALLAAAHARGLKLLMDLVPCHTSIEHPWFRDHPDWYVWADGDAPPNNWVAAFGGPAWTWHERRARWYLHSFYPEQPDLAWRNSEVVAAMQEAVRFWLDRGVDGFRLDAIDRLGKDPQLRDNPPATEPPLFPHRLPDFNALDHIYSKNTTPETGVALAAIREAAGDAFLIGEIYLPTTDWPVYLEHLDRVFAFELFHAQLPWEPAALRAVIERAFELDGAWVFSNHDAARLPTRLGEENVRLAAMLLLTLPGMAFVYQGDEIGLVDGPGADPPFDRAGRDGPRHPMQWESGRNGGFSSAEPWLAAVDPERRNVADQREDPRSLLALYRRLIEFRPALGPGMAMRDAGSGVLAYERGEGHVVALNLGDEPHELSGVGSLVLSTGNDAAASGVLAPHAGAVFERA